MIKAPVKGSLGYVSRLKKHNICFILINVIVAAIIFGIGLFLWNSRSNICTIFAVCSLLPGCKRLVNLIVIFPFKDMNKDDYSIISEKLKLGGNEAIYNDLLVATEKYYLSFCQVFFAKSKMIAYSDMSREKLAFAEEYLNKAFEIRGYDVKVTICDNVKDYIRIASLIEGKDVVSDGEARRFFESLFI